MTFVSSSSLTYDYYINEHIPSIFDECYFPHKKFSISLYKSFLSESFNSFMQTGLFAPPVFSLDIFSHSSACHCIEIRPKFPLFSNLDILDYFSKASLFFCSIINLSSLYTLSCFLGGHTYANYHKDFLLTKSPPISPFTYYESSLNSLNSFCSYLIPSPALNSFNDFTWDNILTVDETNHLLAILEPLNFDFDLDFVNQKINEIILSRQNNFSLEFTLPYEEGVAKKSTERLDFSTYTVPLFASLFHSFTLKTQINLDFLNVCKIYKNYFNIRLGKEFIENYLYNEKSLTPNHFNLILDGIEVIDFSSFFDS